jgi:hypothetical protein
MHRPVLLGALTLTLGLFSAAPVSAAPFFSFAGRPRRLGQRSAGCCRRNADTRTSDDRTRGNWFDCLHWSRPPQT